MINTTKERRLTKKDFYAAIIKATASVDFSEFDKDITSGAMSKFAENELDLLAKKNAADRKPTKVQQENNDLKTKILAVMDTTPATVSEIQKRDDTLAALSNQRVSALIKQMEKEGVVAKVTDKRRSMFALA